jgi:hypothetical protein
VSVYVDDMRAPFGRLIMCHMVADSRDELLAMADRIGVARRWLQKDGTPHEHFDICMAKRALAVKLGAAEIDRAKLAALIGEKRAALQRKGETK